MSVVVKIVDWNTLKPTTVKVYCYTCVRLLGTFSLHESAMNWAQAHARSKVHLRHRGESG